MLFWHNHFSVASINLPEYAIDYVDILRDNAYGNFGNFVEQITICPAMLAFLNGDSNRVGSPNENYARELLELFTIGRGPALGNGDYTYYTEQDVIELAKCLTGWRKSVTEAGDVLGEYNSNRHDKTDKQLSHRFDNRIVSNEEENEYKTVIEIILGKKEVAQYILRQLHIWFISAEISEEVENNFILPLADKLFEDNYELEPTLRTFFSSSYFFDSAHLGCIVSNPVDFISKVMNSLEIHLPEDEVQKYYIWYRYFIASRDMGMQVLNPPSVAGWTAFYQAPLYSRSWINSISLVEREDFINRAFRNLGSEGVFARIDSLAFINKFQNPGDINVLLESLSELLFAVPISENQKSYLKDFLIPGLPDFEWTVEYGMYATDPSNNELEASIRQKVDGLLEAMMKMAEFHLL